jgi:surfactin synthase thioesterase subunit
MGRMNGGRRSPCSAVETTSAFCSAVAPKNGGIVKAVSTDGGLWVREFRQAPPSDIRLVILPHAGGAANFYLRMARALAPAAHVLAVQYPGRQDRLAERCIDDITELVDQVFAELTRWADRPMALFGHSMGAVVAYEVARRFAREVDGIPCHLFVSGRNAPSRQVPPLPLDDAGIVAELRQLNGTDPQLLEDQEIRRMVLPALRGDYRALMSYTYEPGAMLTCPVTAMVGADDPKATVDDVRAWRDHTSGAFDVHTFPGDHFYVAARQTEMIDVIVDHLAEHRGREGAYRRDGVTA